MANPTIGECACPLCGDPAAQIRQGEKRVYIVCEGCVSNIYTMSRKGRELMLARINAPAPAKDNKVGDDATATAAPKSPTPKPPPAPAKPATLGIFGL